MKSNLKYDCFRVTQVEGKPVEVAKLAVKTAAIKPHTDLKKAKIAAARPIQSRMKEVVAQNTVKSAQNVPARPAEPKTESKAVP